MLHEVVDAFSFAGAQLWAFFNLDMVLRFTLDPAY